MILEHHYYSNGIKRSVRTEFRASQTSLSLFGCTRSVDCQFFFSFGQLEHSQCFIIDVVWYNHKTWRNFENLTALRIFCLQHVAVGLAAAAGYSTLSPRDDAKAGSWSAIDKKKILPVCVYPNINYDINPLETHL